MLYIEQFYLDMYTACGNRFADVAAYSKLWALTNEETLESMAIMNSISSKVQG